MCSNDAPMIKPALKSRRTKTRKPKFLSLRLELTPETTQNSGDMKKPTAATTAAAAAHRHQQLNLFPLHPENLVEDKDAAAYFFDAAADGGAATLTTLLGGGSSSSSDDTTTATTQSPSLTYASFGAQDSGEGELVRTAMRNKERESSSEERWVCYSEVVEEKRRKAAEEEVTSYDAGLRVRVRTRGLLALKLDYQEIMDAWCDKGPLYIKSEPPQTVPDLHDDMVGHDYFSNDGWGTNGGGLWTVPENSNISSGNIGNIKVKTEEVTFSQGGEEWKQQQQQPGQREASMLRYKAKRQNRLFSKRIRYEVRKINAEKRPRMKGRFVKRS